MTATRTIPLSRIFGWRPKVDRTLEDVREGRLSYSSSFPIVVSRLDRPRGAFYIIDGYHRVVEAILRGGRDIRVVIDPNVPRIERTGGAHRAYVEEKVGIAEYLQCERPRTPRRAIRARRDTRQRDSVDLSRLTWLASRSGPNGDHALKVLQDVLLERYGRELDRAMRYAKKQKAHYVVLFVPQFTRWLPIQSTFGRLPRISPGSRVTVTDGSGVDSGRHGTIQYVRAGVAALIDDQGRPFDMFASRLREGWGRTSLRYEGPTQKQFAPFVAVPSGRAKHTYRTSLAVWDTEDGFNVHHYTARKG